MVTKGCYWSKALLLNFSTAWYSVWMKNGTVCFLWWWGRVKHRALQVLSKLCGWSWSSQNDVFWGKFFFKRLLPFKRHEKARMTWLCSMVPILFLTGKCLDLLGHWPWFPIKATNIYIVYDNGFLARIPWLPYLVSMAPWGAMDHSLGSTSIVVWRWELEDYY